MKKVILGLIAVGITIPTVFGAALSEARSTRSAQNTYVKLGVVTNTKIYAGAMVAVTNISNVGYAMNAVDGSNTVVIGCADETVDNTTGATGAGDSGALSIRVKCGAFYWDQQDAVTYSNKSSIGQIAYVVDNHTVSVSASGLTSYRVAGIVCDYDTITKQLLVDMGNFAAAGASTPATLAVSGAGTIGTTLAVGSTMTVGSALTVGTSAAAGYYSTTGRVDATVAMRTGSLSANSATVTNLAAVGALTATGTVYGAVNVLGPQGTFNAATVSNLATLGAASLTGTVSTIVGFNVGALLNPGLTKVVTNGIGGEVTNTCHYFSGILTNVVVTE